MVARLTLSAAISKTEDQALQDVDSYRDLIDLNHDVASTCMQAADTLGKNGSVA